MIVNGENMPTFNSCKKSDSLLLQVIRRCNSFFMQGLRSCQGECRPLFANGRQIGLIRPDLSFYLTQYPEVFTSTPSAFHLNANLNTYESRSDALGRVLNDLRSKNIFIALAGWRDEDFNVWADFGQEPLFKIERSAASLLGIRAYGCHVNGYVKLDDGNTYVWIQKRSITKPTYPGMLDLMVGGGVTAGLTPAQVVIKEADEEASIPYDIMKQSTPAGTVSFITETERGIHANTEFVFDVELPKSFIPRNKDDEVEGFELIPIEELPNRVLSPQYKLTSIPIAVDFLIRKGIINCENEPNLPAVQELLHVPLHQFYSQWPIYPTQSILALPS